MDSTQLYEAFREDVVDVARPYLWTDDEVFRYMDTAQKQFVRLTDGIAGTLEIPAVTGERDIAIPDYVLNIRRVVRKSDMQPLELLNITDLDGSDYGVILKMLDDRRQGALRYLVIGETRGVGQLINIPAQDDTLALSIYRMPLATLTGDGQALEVQEMHHPYLLEYMKDLAYRKQDAETFDRAKSDECRQQFEVYCAQAKAEWARYKHKPRSISYGGI